MILRYSKILLVCAIAFFASLVAFGNITDYGSNFAFVHHVLLMDTIFPDATIKYRAIESVFWHHAFYIFIISLEALTAILCWAGAWCLFKRVNGSARDFNRGKSVAIAGLVLGFLIWQVGFMSVGGEWFGMWMSSQWNGVPDAFRFFITIGVVLIILIQPDPELHD